MRTARGFHAGGRLGRGLLAGFAPVLVAAGLVTAGVASASTSCTVQDGLLQDSACIPADDQWARADVSNYEGHVVALRAGTIPDGSRGGDVYVWATFEPATGGSQPDYYVQVQKREPSLQIGGQPKLLASDERYVPTRRYTAGTQDHPSSTATSSRRARTGWTVKAVRTASCCTGWLT